MAIRLNRVATRITIYQVLIMAVLFPLLAALIVIAAQDSLKNSFVSHARTYARLFADTLELQAHLSSADIVPLLDGVILSGNGVYAEFKQGTETFVSELNPATLDPREDFVFGDHGDQTYFITTVVANQDDQAKLILGFDENPTQQALADLRGRIIYFIITFAGISIAALIIFVRRLIKPLTQLQRDARAVTSGDAHRALQSSSGLYEIDQLTKNLEEMRIALVGTNQRLSEEIVRRSQAVESNRLLEEQLQQARSLETIGTLAGGVAHEFNNLLLPMRLNIELAIDDLDENDSEVIASLDSIRRSIIRAEDVVRQVLVFSRQQVDLNHQSVNVASVLAEAFNLLKPTFPPHIHATLNILRSDLKTSLHESQLHQVVVNLVKNALNAMQDKGTSLAVSLDYVTLPPGVPRTYVKSEGYSVISIADDGIGMSPETRTRALDPFFTTRSAGMGIGLGLTVVQGIVSSAAGHLTITSEPDRGTEVMLYLPTR